MKKLLIWALLACLLIPVSLAEGGPIELSGLMYQSLSGAAERIGGMTFEGDWDYANDIEQAYVRDDLTLAGNVDDEIKFIMIGQPCQYALFGIQVGLNVSALEPLYTVYDHRSFTDAGMRYDYVTFREDDDGYVEVLWTVSENDVIQYAIYEAGYGHG